MPVLHAALRAELLAGSFASLYSAGIAAGDYNILVDTINTIGLTGSSIIIGIVNATTMQQCVVLGEYSALPQQHRDLWNCIVTTATNGLSLSNAAIRAQIGGIWSATTVTRSNLVSAQTRSCSRGETLFGENIVVNVAQIYVAVTQP